MAEIGTLECKIHVTALGIPELEHLLEVLSANVENLPTIVVRAMESLAESDPNAPRTKKIEIAPLQISGSTHTHDVSRALSMDNQRIIPIR